jgi:hypothetical protein
MIIISSMALLSLMLAVCGGAKKVPITVPAEAQAGDLIDLEPYTYEANKVEARREMSQRLVRE